jgi:hypothetical protein
MSMPIIPIITLKYIKPLRTSSISPFSKQILIKKYKKTIASFIMGLADIDLTFNMLGIINNDTANL